MKDIDQNPKAQHPVGSEHRRRRARSFAAFLGSLLLLAIGTIAGYVLENRRVDRSNDVRSLDYEVESSAVLPSGTLPPGKEVSITIDGKDATNVTRLDLSVYNFSDKDFFSVRFFVDMVPNYSSPKLSDLIMAEWPAGAYGIPDSVTSLPDLKPPLRTGTARFAYEVRTLNRSAFQIPSFKVSYFLLGGPPPVLEVRTDKAGVMLRKLVPENDPRRRTWFSPELFYLLCGVSLVLLVLLVAYVWTARCLADALPRKYWQQFPATARFLVYIARSRRGPGEKPQTSRQIN